MSDPDYWEERRRFIEAGARRGGAAGMKAAERAWREREKKPRHIYEDQDPACQDGPCGSAPLGCADKRYCPRAEHFQYQR